MARECLGPGAYSEHPLTLGGPAPSVSVCVYPHLDTHRHINCTEVVPGVANTMKKKKQKQKTKPALTELPFLAAVVAVRKDTLNGHLLTVHY